MSRKTTTQNILPETRAKILLAVAMASELKLYGFGENPKLKRETVIDIAITDLNNKLMDMKLQQATQKK